MKLIQNAALELVKEMDRQNRTEATVYTLNPGTGFPNITQALVISEVLIGIVGEVDMVIGTLSKYQLEILAGRA